MSDFVKIPIHDLFVYKKLTICYQRGFQSFGEQNEGQYPLLLDWFFLCNSILDEIHSLSVGSPRFFFMDHHERKARGL